MGAASFGGGWIDTAQSRLVRADWYEENGRDDLAAECRGMMPGPDTLAELPRYGYGYGYGYGGGYGYGYGHN